MNDMTIFNYEGNEVRTVTVNNEPWWVLKDVCDVLGLSDTNKVAERLEVDELTRIKFVSGGQTREMLCVNEPGLYSVILRSDKPEAKKFKRWVTHEVLPAIRKTGKYETPKKAKEPKTNLSSVNNAVKIIGQYMEQAKLDSDVRLLTVKGLYAQAGVMLPFDISAEKMYFDTKQIAKRLGIMSSTGNPAYTAVSQIFKKLNLSADDAKEFLEEVNQTGKWQGTVMKYAESAVDKLEAWLLERGYPTTIEGESKNYHVVYDITA